MTPCARRRPRFRRGRARRRPSDSDLLLKLADLIEENLDELAQLESIDNGKPLSLAQQLDIPRAVANFRFFATAILHQSSEAHVTDGGRAQLHAAPAARRRRPDLAVEPAAVPVDLEDRAGPRGGKHVRRQAVRADAADRAPARRALARSGHPARRAQHRARPRQQGRAARCPATTTSPRSRSPAAPSPARRSPRTPRRGSRSCRWSWAARTRTSSSPTPISTTRSPTIVRSASGTRARSACAARASSSSDPIHDEFVERFVAATKKLRIGDPLDEATDVGALISEAHLQKVMGYIDLAKKEGGTIVAGGTSRRSSTATSSSRRHHRPRTATAASCRKRSSAPS